MMAPDDIRRLAATFVLGTLDGDERAQARARRADDPDFAALVRLWEERLAPLHVLSPAVRPPEGLWDDILAALPVPAPEDLGTASPDAPSDAPADGVEIAEEAITAQSVPLRAGEAAPLAGPPAAQDVSPGAVRSADAPAPVPVAEGPPLQPAQGEAAIALPAPPLSGALDGASPSDGAAAAPVLPNIPRPDIPSPDTPSPEAPPPDTSAAPTVQPTPADVLLSTPPDGTIRPAAEAVPPAVPSGPDRDDARPMQPEAPVESASAPRGADAAADAPAAGDDRVVPEPEPDTVSEPASAPRPAPQPGAGEGIAPVSSDPALPEDTGPAAPGSALPRAEEAEPGAPEQVPPPVAPRGPFDIVLDRPAPTGQEGTALPPAGPASEGGNPWRLTTGLLLVAGLIGGAAVAYREAHRQPPPPDVFAPLKSAPHPQMVLAFDPEAGDVVVRQLDEAPPAGMVYRMWLVSHAHGTRALCTFTEAGRCPAGALGEVGRAGLMSGMLQVTLEPAAMNLSTPTGKVVFFGRALTR
ncbi:hypothetical protein J5J86_08965 [Aquabacter sp. L1I39]|uniref:hypothetical protein n=1 Tax=Aquabacter sp. L1I39 TaxID=2820278 RepID=UPI001AD9DBA9|nr:hypothetical protein [Aquabacter sp. L1I39]QTL05393.1 hypothetical protein J5J86_08965 [Aquabacter sp. L1I39]